MGETDPETPVPARPARPADDAPAGDLPGSFVGLIPDESREIIAAAEFNAAIARMAQDGAFDHLRPAAGATDEAAAPEDQPIP